MRFFVSHVCLTEFWDERLVRQNRRLEVSAALNSHHSNWYDVLMSRGNPNWGTIETLPWRYRIRGKTPDGKMVSLGNYRSKEEATPHYEKLVEQRYYKQLTLQTLGDYGPRTPWRLQGSAGKSWPHGKRPTTKWPRFASRLK